MCIRDSLSPSDDIQAKWIIEEISKINGPVYVRLARLATEVIYDENQKFEIGKAIMHGDGTDGTVFATGVTVQEDVYKRQIYGVTMIILYTMSSIYHGLSPKRYSKRVFQVLDHCSIFLRCL